MSRNQYSSQQFKVIAANHVFAWLLLTLIFTSAPRDEVSESATSQMIYVGIMIAVLLFLIVAAFTSYRCRKMRSFNQVQINWILNIATFIFFVDIVSIFSVSTLCLKCYSRVPIKWLLNYFVFQQLIEIDIQVITFWVILMCDYLFPFVTLLTS